ncbi:MAG TPA: sigma-E factor regulatory protein RseB domain-containing protein [Actinomycetota bacterium]
MARVIRSRSVAVAVVAALALALVAGLSAVRASPRPDLPAVAPDLLIASSLRAVAERVPVSGDVTTHVDLGLPPLPSGLSDPGCPASVLVSDSRFRVWRSPDGVRVAQLLPFGECDAVANPTDAWFWDSNRSTAWHASIPAASTSPGIPTLGDLADVVAKALHKLTPYAAVSLADPTVVAGRDAYVVRLSPTDAHTLIGHVDVAIDAATRLPLRLSVVPKGSDVAAIEAGFTSVGFAPIDPAMFGFSPPQGATVKQVQLGSLEGHGPAGGNAAVGAGMPQVRVFGQGFGLVLAVQVASTDVPRELRSLFPYAGPLGSADLVERGDHAWIVAGAVAPGRLAEVEPSLP